MCARIVDFYLLSVNLVGTTAAFEMGEILVELWGNIDLMYLLPICLRFVKRRIDFLEKI